LCSMAIGGINGFDFSHSIRDGGKRLHPYGDGFR
jgi:hypothetical protein